MASAKVSASLRSQLANGNPFKRILRLAKTTVALAPHYRQRKSAQKPTSCKA
jgi:hypothetical protein